jgi:uncharacterized protein YjbI with pentapeptide repeats
VTDVFDKQLFTVSSLWGFELSTGKAVLEQKLWRTVAKAIADGELFDAGYPKVKAEYLVSGCFMSKEPVTGGIIDLKIGSLKKSLAVFGDRYWSASGFLGPEPVSVMPIRYENAFGGKQSKANPVGKGLEEVSFEGSKRIPIPNIEYHERLMTAKSDRPPPASLNRVEPIWPLRQALAGTYNQKYIEERMPGFPEDIDPRYFNDAPEDQRFEGYMAGDEEFLLTGMNLEHPALSGRLPGIRARLFIEVDRETENRFIELENELDTVWFFPNENLGVLIHRGSYSADTVGGKEIAKVLIGHELLANEPRTKEHYQDQLSKRSDPEDGFKYMMNTTDLIPAGVMCGIRELMAETDPSLKGQAQINITEYIDRQTASAKQSISDQLSHLDGKQPTDMAATSIDEVLHHTSETSDEQKKVEALMEKILPNYAGTDEGMDLTKLNIEAVDELSEYIEELARESEDKAISSVRERIDALRMDNPNNDAANQLEKSLDMRHQPKPLPRVSRDIDAQLESVRSQLEQAEQEMVILQSMGVDPTLSGKKLTDLDELTEKLKMSKSQAEAGYRVVAHYVENACSPHPDSTSDLRLDFMSKLGVEHGLVGWDGAFADLSGISVNGQLMNNAYLEYLVAPGSEWTDVDLSEAILVHANLKSVRFTRCRFKEANLGASKIEDAIFIDCVFEGAGFGRADILNSRFEKCFFSDKMDAFMESNLSGVEFVDCELKRSNFYELNLDHCRFERSSLDESNLLKCQFSYCVFQECSLKGVNVVSCNFEEASFDHSDLDNVRFVMNCDIARASFKNITAELANFRECSLHQADFSNARISRSDFSGAIMTEVVMDNAYVRESMFIGTNLERGQLFCIDAMEASFQDARLTGANFKNANLYGASFYGVVVGDTDFSSANLKKTLFKDWRPGRG